jgi:hypothetical protein
MARSFFQSILTWFAGCAIGVILTSIIFKLGWADKERILVLGYGALLSVVVFYTKFTSQIKRQEMLSIDEKFSKKADSKDIEKVQCQIDIMHQTLDFMVKNQEEEHATVDNIYALLIGNHQK